uniref:Uncharacterized protein n=1 Tax=Salvator merianae TaxID=96440 RepID=A0A8D0DZB0_SALMN
MSPSPFSVLIALVLTVLPRLLMLVLSSIIACEGRSRIAASRSTVVSNPKFRTIMNTSSSPSSSLT